MGCLPQHPAASAEWATRWLQIRRRRTGGAAASAAAASRSLSFLLLRRPLTPPCGSGWGGAARLDANWLEGAADGLIALTGGERGAVGSLLLEHAELAVKRLLRLKQIFADRLYAELQRQAGFDARIEAMTVDLAYHHALPLVATNEAFFAAADDYEAHDALLAIADGALLADDNRRRLGPDYCLQSQAHMSRLFADLPEALSNSVEIAKRCSFFPGKRDPILPKFVTGAEENTRCSMLARRWVLVAGRC